MRTPSESPPEVEEEIPRVDLMVPDGCPLCDGPMHLRITPLSAWALCGRCEYLASPDVIPSSPGRYELSFLPTVEV